MLKIGEFARLCQVNTQTLRYYDAEGVLPADHVDTFTGYRYYHPDKLETFRQIRLYQDIGFSLDEIKILLGDDSESRMKLMYEKRRKLSFELHVLQGKLSQLELLSHEREKREEETFDSYVYNPDFENDPKALGVWTLYGQLDAPIDGDVPSPEAPLIPSNGEQVPPFPRLVLRPEGRPWWILSWSRGKICFLNTLYHSVVPSLYTLWERSDGRYMTLRFCSAVKSAADDPIWLLYRQTDNRALSERESRAFIDDVDLPLIPDPAVMGTWETVDYVSDLDDFSPESPHCRRVDLWISEMAFLLGNNCLRRVAMKGGIVDQHYVYTRTEGGEHRGVVIRHMEQVAEAYEIRHVGDADYLFIQHKSGDYMYGGFTPAWYVFRRTRYAMPERSLL